MMMTRSHAVTAAVAVAAALAATGITYASAASQPAQAVHAPFGGSSSGNESKGNEGRNNEGRNNEGRNEGRGNEGREFHEEGRIQINERSYSARPGDCITVVSGLGAKTLNIRNDSRKTVEVFRGAVCDNGAPVATVGPHSQSDGVHVDCVDGIHVDDGVVGSFRVIRDRDDHGDREQS
ncbi:hypothetical protein [Streptomyces mirabilis]|uniref:DUF5666 domain-containing protein n=1 Tax=Streptomyces mirabilis TaxID=68239 RepID=A0ABU3V6T7_9ACTN|nr:hypothetical protein [Streptomyces mirabilis]MCX5356788.1 hypothetical protein [Streptomyces mirabilis]MDU9001901.1 hypothetical protein [Streptomyces mirabilis]